MIELPSAIAMCSKNRVRSGLDASTEVVGWGGCVVRLNGVGRLNGCNRWFDGRFSHDWRDWFRNDHCLRNDDGRGDDWLGRWCLGNDSFGDDCFGDSYDNTGSDFSGHGVFGFGNRGGGFAFGPDSLGWLLHGHPDRFVRAAAALGDDIPHQLDDAAAF